MVQEFHDGVTNKAEELRLKHDKDLITLATLRKNYERLLVRTGFEKEAVKQSFEKKRRKDLYAIKKKNKYASYDANFSIKKN